MNKPYVIIHTHTSIDGNIAVMDLHEFDKRMRVWNVMDSLFCNKEEKQ